MVPSNTGSPLDRFAAVPDIAAAVRTGRVDATAVVAGALDRVARIGPSVNAFTDVTGERAMRQAAAIDAARKQGRPLGPLAGVPFAVKNLFDVAGLPTRAGSRINRERTPATVDATLIRRLTAAGAVLVGALNMGEYAYDFTGENAHDGACRNPHDPARMSGGSSSGSGAAAGAGLVPLTLGSDTNGSIRVPASLCGVFGLKPTYGRLSRHGTFPFCDSLDHLGPLARTTAGLALAYDAMQGHDAGDHACTPRPVEPVAGLLDRGIDGLRVAVAGGWFDTEGLADAAEAVSIVAAALGASGPLPLEWAPVARAAAFLITNVESSTFHLDRLRTRADDFDPDTRDRFLAGALLPAAWAVRAQQARRWAHAEALATFAEVDVLIAPATPFTAPAIGQKTIELNGKSLPLRPNLGLFTQPFSALGLPVVAVPVRRPGRLPIGVQIVAAPWREDICLRVAARLEADGIAAAKAPVV